MESNSEKLDRTKKKKKWTEPQGLGGPVTKHIYVIVVLGNEKECGLKRHL